MSVYMLEIDEPVIITDGGASRENIGVLDDEPTWVQSTVLLSQAAANIGYQWSVWILGIWSASGFSENVTA
jgi:hypothetical protein